MTPLPTRQSSTLSGPTSPSSSESWNRMDETTRYLVERMLYHSDPMARRLALAKAVTLIETKHPVKKLQADQLLTFLLEQQQIQNAQNENFRIGLAGPPGAGKSSMIEALGKYILDEKKSASAAGDDDEDHKSCRRYRPDKLAVVCIDPSSSVSGGSILGDKTRMEELSRHPRAFVRPSANSGVVGGLAAYTDDVVSTCQAAGYPLVLLETVGLGQSEIDVAQSVDLLLLMLPPGGGDELQGVKKGIMEVADIFCVTKADGDLLTAAKHTAADYRAAVKFLNSATYLASEAEEPWNPPVLLTSSATGDGLGELWEAICRFKEHSEISGQLEKKRKRQAEFWMWKHLSKMVQDKTHQDPQLASVAENLQTKLLHSQITPRVAASHLLDSLFQQRRPH